MLLLTPFMYGMMLVTIFLLFKQLHGKIRIYDAKSVLGAWLGLSAILATAMAFLGSETSFFAGPTHRLVYILLDNTAFLVLAGFVAYRFFTGAGLVLLNIPRDRVISSLTEMLEKRKVPYELPKTSDPSMYKKFILKDSFATIRLMGVSSTGQSSVWVDRISRMPDGSGVLAELKTVLLNEKPAEGVEHAKGMLVLFGAILFFFSLISITLHAVL